VLGFMLQPPDPWGRVPDTYWVRGWVGFKISLSMVAKKKNPCLGFESQS